MKERKNERNKGGRKEREKERMTKKQRNNEKEEEENNIQDKQEKHSQRNAFFETSPTGFAGSTGSSVAETVLVKGSSKQMEAGLI